MDPTGVRMRITTILLGGEAHFKDGVSNGFGSRSTRNFTPRRDEARQVSLIDVISNFDASRSIPENMFVG
jgi:hypothetical protein